MKSVRKNGKKTFEIREHEAKERKLQNELRMLREERTRTENEALRNQAVQIEQLEAKTRLQSEKQKEERMRQEKEISQLKEKVEEGIRRRESLEEKVERERECQKQLKEKAKLKYDKMRKERITWS